MIPVPRRTDSAARVLLCGRSLGIAANIGIGVEEEERTMTERAPRHEHRPAHRRAIGRWLGATILSGALVIAFASPAGAISTDELTTGAGELQAAIAARVAALQAAAGELQAAVVPE